MSGPVLALPPIMGTFKTSFGRNVLEALILASGLAGCGLMDAVAAKEQVDVNDTSTDTAPPPGTTGRASDVVNVKDFGAVGDGVADDSAAIQRALNAGHSLVFPPGIYRITSSLNLTNNTEGWTLTGTGQGFFVGSAPMQTMATIVWGGGDWPIIDGSGSFNIHIRDIMIHAPAATPASVGVLFARTSYGSTDFHRLDRVEVTGHYRVAAIYENESEGNKYIDVRAINDMAGLHAYGYVRTDRAVFNVQSPYTEIEALRARISFQNVTIGDSITIGNWTFTCGTTFARGATGNDTANNLKTAVLANAGSRGLLAIGDANAVRITPGGTVTIAFLALSGAATIGFAKSGASITLENPFQLEEWANGNNTTGNWFGGFIMAQGGMSYGAALLNGVCNFNFFGTYLQNLATASGTGNLELTAYYNHGRSSFSAPDKTRLYSNTNYRVAANVNLVGMRFEGGFHGIVVRSDSVVENLLISGTNVGGYAPGGTFGIRAADNSTFLRLVTQASQVTSTANAAMDVYNITDSIVDLGGTYARVRGASIGNAWRGVSDNSQLAISGARTGNTIQRDAVQGGTNDRDMFQFDSQVQFSKRVYIDQIADGPVFASSGVLTQTNPVGVPATATSTGHKGQFAADASWFYVCTDTDTWRRMAIAAW